MALVPVVASSAAAASFEELDMGNTVESVARFLDSQKELFHSQIDQLQRLVVAQCKLTGVNPLSQEMAAGALSIKIGKKPRDLLNPKATQYMQSLFSIKDTIGKKETREISALCGITITQVREYFAGQRSRVRKLVRLSREKALRLDASKASKDGCVLATDQSLLVSKVTPDQSLLISKESPDVSLVSKAAPDQPLPVNKAAPDKCLLLSEVVPDQPLLVSKVTPDQPLLVSKEASKTSFDIRIGGESMQVLRNSGVPITGQDVQHHPTNSTLKIVGVPATVQNGQQNLVKTELKSAEEGPSCSPQEEAVPGIDSDDKKFLENIFNLMRKEETFSGQVKLMEWVLQIHNTAVLHWFLTKGGITILAAWLSEAAIEEQTTVLLVIFKVLCHLPLRKAPPAQMSAILQTVNRLRFYRTSDISNRAKILLSKWSKMFVRSQALKNPSYMNSSKNGRMEIIQKQRMGEICTDESWQSKIDISEEILALAESTEDNRNSEPRRILRLLPESSDASNKKHSGSVSSLKIKERRKVLLVEQPEHKTAGRSVQVAKKVPPNHSRPLSADDIQKAKMRAVFMQNKYGKNEAAANENNPQKTEHHEVSPPLHQTSNKLPSKPLPQIPQPQRDEVGKPPAASMTTTVSHKLETTINLKPNSISKEQLWEKLKRDQLSWNTPPEINISNLWRVGAGENSKEVGIQVQRNRREKETFYPNSQDIPPNPKDPWDVEMDFDDSLTPEIPIEQSPDAEVSASAVPEVSMSSTQDGRNVVESSPATVLAPPPSVSSSGAAEPDLELLAVLLKNPDLVFALTSGQGKSFSSDETVALLDMLKKSGVALTGIINGMVNAPNEKPKEPEPTSLPSPTPPADHTRSGWRSEFPSHAKAPLFQPHFSGSGGATVPSTIVPQTPLPAQTHLPSPPQTPAIPLRLQPKAPTTILSLPQLTVTINPSPQQIPAPNFVQQPNPASFLQTPPHAYQSLPQTLNPEFITNTNPSMSGLLPTQLRRQSTMQSEPLPPPPRITSWPAAATSGVANVSRQEAMRDTWSRRPNGLVEGAMPSSHIPTNLNSYNNAYPNGSMPQFSGHRALTGDRGDAMDGWGLDNWSSVDSPMRSSTEFGSGHNYSEPTRDFGWSRPDWSRQWGTGHRDQYQSGGGPGGRRRRDRDRDRDRRR